MSADDLLLLILRYGEAKYLCGAEGPLVERLEAFHVADRVLNEIVSALHPARPGAAQ